MRRRVEDLLDLEPMPKCEVSFGLCSRNGATFRRMMQINEGLHITREVFRMPALAYEHLCLAFNQDALVAVLDFKRTANPWGLESMCFAPRLSRPTPGSRVFPALRRRHRCAVGALLADGLERASRSDR